MKNRLVRLGEIAVQDRRIIDPASSEAARRSYLGLEQIDPGSGKIISYQSASEEGKSTTFAFDDRHVLYGKLRPYLNKVALPESEGRCSTEIIPFLPHQVDREYLAYLLRSDEIVRVAMADKTGSRMPRADMDALLRHEVVIPQSLDEQRRIAAHLKAQLAAAYEARQAAQIRQTELTKLRSALLKAAFNDVGSETFFLDDALLGIEAGKSFQTTEVLAGENELGVLKVSAVSWTAFKPEEAKAVSGYKPDDIHRVRKNDLLISRANTRELVGAVVLVEKDYLQRLLSDKTLRLIVNPEKADKMYLLYALRSAMARKHIEHFATGTSDSMRNISQGVILSVPILLPAIEEQRRISSQLKLQFAAVAEAETASAAELADIERLPARLLAQAFNPHAGECHDR